MKLRIAISAKEILGLLLFLYIISACLIPADYMNIKKIFGLLFIALSIPVVITCRNIWTDIVVFFSLGYSIFTIVLSLIVSNVKASFVISRGYIAIYLLMVIPIVYFELDYEKNLILALKIIVIIVIIGVILDAFGILGIYQNPIYNFLRITENAKIGKSSSLIALGYMVYLKAIALLVILLGRSIEEKRILWIMLTSVAIFLSGSRALWLTGMLLFFIAIASSKKLQHSKFKWAFLLIVVLCGLVYVSDIVGIIKNSFYLKESGDLERRGHLISEWTEITKSISSFLFGSGYGNTFFSEGTGKTVYVTELSYFELLRQNGFVFFLVFIVFLIVPLRVLWKKDRTLLWIYLMYLIIAYTNPLLYTSTAYIMYTLVYSKYIQCQMTEDVDVMINHLLYKKDIDES